MKNGHQNGDRFYPWQRDLNRPSSVCVDCMAYETMSRLMNQNLQSASIDCSSRPKYFKRGIGLPPVTNCCMQTDLQRLLSRSFLCISLILFHWLIIIFIFPPFQQTNIIFRPLIGLVSFKNYTL